MGSGERGVPICITTLRAPTGRIETLNGIALPFVPAGTIWFTLAGELLLCPPSHSGCGAADGRYRLLAEAELGLVAPHAVQDDGELAGDSDASARHAAPLGDLHAPGAQARPFAAPHEQRVGCLIECRAGEFVATAAYLALDVRFAGLITPWRQAERRPHSESGGTAPVGRLSRGTRAR